MNVMPDSAQQNKEKGSEELFYYYWTCIRCGQKREVHSSGPPDIWEADPDYAIQEPGTLPEPPQKEPDEWENASQLSELQKELVRECWKMVDSLKGSLTIHKIDYLWRLREALENESIEDTSLTAKDYVDLMDYEELHGQEYGSYHGEIGDYSLIKNILFKLDVLGSWDIGSRVFTETLQSHAEGGLKVRRVAVE